MYYGNKVMTSAVVNLAVKGYLRIEEEDGQHTLTYGHDTLIAAHEEDESYAGSARKRIRLCRACRFGRPVLTYPGRRGDLRPGTGQQRRMVTSATGS